MKKKQLLTHVVNVIKYLIPLFIFTLCKNTLWTDKTSGPPPRPPAPLSSHRYATGQDSAALATSSAAHNNQRKWLNAYVNNNQQMYAKLHLQVNKKLSKTDTAHWKKPRQNRQLNSLRLPNSIQ